MKKVLLRFYLKKSKIEDKVLLIWSVILPTDIDEISDEKNINFLKNRFEKIKLENKDFYLSIDVSTNYNKEDLKNEYQLERDYYFLKCREKNENISPFNNSSAKVKTFYKESNTFLKEYEEYISSIESKYNLSFLKVNLFEKILLKIEKIIGLHIIKNGSTIGTLSEYEKYPAFEIKFDFNKYSEKKYIKIIPLEELDVKQFFVHIEVNNSFNSLNGKNRIIFSKISEWNIEKNKIFECDFSKEFEPISEFWISIFQKDGDMQYSKIFEDNGNIIGSVILNINLESGNKYTKSRFNISQNKEILQKKTLTTPINKNVTSNYKEDSWIKWEQDFYSYLYGKDKKYLVSKYFTKEKRDEFPKWIGKKINEIENLIIVDPYFDYNGLEDFYTCLERTSIELKLITTAPETSPKEEFAKNIIKISKSKKTEVYYIPKGKLHDRYIIGINRKEEIVVFNMSNSWNGAVNNYDLFIQEVPYDIALQIWDNIEEILKDKNIEKFDIELLEQDNEKKVVILKKTDNNKKINGKKLSVAISYFFSKKDIERFPILNKKNKNYKQNCPNLNISLYDKLSNIINLEYNNNINESRNYYKIIVEKMKEIKDVELKELLKEVINKVMDEYTKQESILYCEKDLSEYFSNFKLSYERVRYSDRIREHEYYNLGMSYHNMMILVFLLIIIPNDVINDMSIASRPIKAIKTVTTEEDINVKLPITFFELLWYNTYFLSEEKRKNLALNIKNWFYPKLFLIYESFYFKIRKVEQDKIRIDSFLEKLDINIKEIGFSEEEIILIYIDIAKQIMVVKGYENENYHNEIFKYIKNFKEEYILEYLCIVYDKPHIIQNIFFIDLNSEIKSKIIQILALKSFEIIPEFLEIIYTIFPRDENLEKYIILSNDIELQKDIVYKSYMNYLYFSIFEISKKIIENNKSNILKKIVRKIDIDFATIFGIDRFKEGCDKIYYLFYILTYIIFEYTIVLNGVKDENINYVKNMICTYIPKYFDMYESFNFISDKIVSILGVILTDEEKHKIINTTKSIRYKLLFLSDMNMITDNIIEKCKELYEMRFRYERYISSENIVECDLFINLCIRSILSNYNTCILNNFLEELYQKLQKELKEKFYEFESMNEKEKKLVLIEAAYDSVKIKNRQTIDNFIDKLKRNFCYKGKAFLMEQSNTNMKNEKIDEEIQEKKMLDLLAKINEKYDGILKQI